MKKTYVPLHVHTSFSMLDSMAKIPELVSKAKKLGIKSLAITDHGGVYGHVKFYKECIKQGIKPILGIEAYFCENASEKERKSDHLILLAENNKGLQNLYKIITWANVPIEKGGKFYYRARIDFDLLKKYNEGLICLTACIGGTVPRNMIHNGYDAAKEMAQKFLDIFGPDRFFLEIQDVNEDDVMYLPEQKIVIDMSRKMAKELGLKCVATNDIHYIEATDAFPHEILKAISSKCTLKDPIKGDNDKRGRMVFSGFDYYLKSYEEMSRKFLPEELKITNEIASRCNVTMDFKQNHMPQFDKNKTKDEVYELLLRECRNGWKSKKIAQNPNKEQYIERMQKELSDIKEANLQNYFMIVWDVVREAKSRGIGRGFSRGSAGGSLVLYLLDITRMDPIKYGAKWERFWNRGRTGSMPDVDLDFAIDRREEIIDYLKNKFGKNNVMPMVTFSTESLKEALKDVGKVLGFTFDYMNNMTKMVPYKSSSIDDAIKENERLSEMANRGMDEDVEKWNKELVALKTSKELKPISIKTLEEKITTRKKMLKQLFKIAKRLEDCYRHRSRHACAILISDIGIFGNIPLCYDPANKKMLTAFDMYDLDEIGYLKLDILGLKTVSVIDRICENGTDSIENFEDQKTFTLIGTGNTKGIFQLEKPLGRHWSKAVKPQSIEELADVVALIRPAVLETGLADQYIKNKTEGTTSYLHPDLEPILSSTYGVMLHQEQMMDIVNKFAGFSLEESDHIRKACGKKLPEEMKKYKQDFVQGCIKNQYDEETAKQLWDWIEASAAYNFNKCISCSTEIYRGGGKGRYNRKITIEHLYKTKNNIEYAKSTNSKALRSKMSKYGYGNILALDGDGRIRPRKIKDIMYRGKKETYTITLSNGLSVRATKDHRFFSQDNDFITVDAMKVGKTILIIDGGYEKTDLNEISKYSNKNNDWKYRPYAEPKCGFANGINNPAYTNGAYTAFAQSKTILSDIQYCQKCGDTNKRIEHHHIDGDRTNGDINNIIKLCVSCHKKEHYSMGRVKRWQKGHVTNTATVTSIEYYGYEDTYDIEMDTVEHNFIANKLVSANSHAIGYALLAYTTAYFKRYYPLKFFCAMLQLAGNKQKPQEEISELFYDAQLYNIKISPPRLSRGNVDFEIKDNVIYYGLSKIKQIGTSSLSKLPKTSSWKSIIENKDKFKKDLLQALILSGALDDAGETRLRMKSQIEFLDGLSPKEVIFFDKWMSDKNETYVKTLKNQSFTIQCIAAKDFDEALQNFENFLNKNNDKSKIVMKRRVPIIQSLCQRYRDMLKNGDEMSVKEMAGYEIYYLGIPATCSEADVYSSNRKTHSCLNIQHDIDGRKVGTIGIINRINEKTDRNGNKMAFVSIFDKSYMIDIILFHDAYAKYKHMLELGKVMFIEGKKQKGSLIVSNMEEMNNV